MEVVQKDLKRYYPHTFSKFLENLSYKIELLKFFPPMYQIYEKPNKRRAPLSHGYMLIYEFKNNTIYISRILNSKQSQKQ